MLMYMLCFGVIRGPIFLCLKVTITHYDMNETLD